MAITLEEKIQQLLTSSESGLNEANTDGTKLPCERDDLDSENVGKLAAGKEKKTKFPGNEKGVEMTQQKQGSSDAVKAPVEELGAEEDGKQASAKAKYAGGLQAKGGADTANSDYKTTTDGTKVVTAKSSRGNVDGMRLETIDLTPIFGDSDLSEEFKDKATSLFEAVVQARVNHEFEALQEQYQTELEEEVSEIKEQLVEKIDVFLDKVVESWINENRLAVEAGLRTEIAEDFMSGLKNLFKESYIEVPEDKYDVLSDLEEKVQSLQAKLEEQTELNEALIESNDKMLKDAVFIQATEGLAATEVEKLKSLVEGVSYETAESFADKLRVIKENYFPKTQFISAEKTLLENAIGDGQFSENSSVEIYAQAISKTLKK